MSIRSATRADLVQILALYTSARAAMAAAGNPTQWGSLYPPQALVEEDIVSNRQFLVLDRGRVAGTFAYMTGPDPTYAQIDGEWLNDTAPYGVMHRIASAPGGSHVADEVLAWCLERCENLRVDTHADNAAMQHILAKNGFTQCGVIRTDDGTPRLAYQKLK